MTPARHPANPGRSASAHGPCALALAMVLAACGTREPEGAPRPGAEPAAAPQALDPASDPRLAPLFVRCERDGHYDVDTSDPIAILEETLLVGQLDPLRRARVELAESGPAGLAVARRILDLYLDDPAGQGWVRNALDVVALSREPEAHDLVLRALASPREELRAIALRMMRTRGTRQEPQPGHGLPGDFDAVLAVLSVATATTLRDAALVLHDLDPARAEGVYADWLEQGTLPELWDDLLPHFAASEQAATLEWCRAHWREVEPPQRHFLAAAAARAGEAEALELLRSASAGEDLQQRAWAIHALAAASATDELLRLLASETRCDLKQVILRALAQAPDEPRVRAALQQATGDACDEIRLLSLEALCARGDSRAFERAQSQLETGNSIELVLIMRALRGALPSQPEFAGRVLARLMARHERESGQSAGERAPLLQAIGQVPLEQAARFLIERSRVEHEPIQSFEPHRWLCLQVANTGEQGTPVLLAELERERDPRRRIDLLEGLAAPGGEAARAALLALVQGDTLTPFETVYVAERLVTLGPVARIAPVLKRVTLRVEEPASRRALQCLLWKSYPSKKRS